MSSLHCLEASERFVHIFHLYPSSNPNHQDFGELGLLSVLVPKYSLLGMMHVSHADIELLMKDEDFPAFYCHRKKAVSWQH